MCTNFGSITKVTKNHEVQPLPLWILTLGPGAPPSERWCTGGSPVVASVAAGVWRGTMSKASAKDSAPTWAHALAGQVAGMVGLSVVHPVDTVKIRVQANGGHAISTASSLVRRDGPLALYRGIGAPMVAYGLINAVAFSTNTAVVRTLREGMDSTRVSNRGPGEPSTAGRDDSVAGVTPTLFTNHEWLVGLAGGGAAGLTSSFIRGPAERVKTVQQVAESSCGTGGVPEKYKGTLRTAMTLTREHGICKGLFTGTGATIAREVPQCAVYFLTYDAIRRACENAAGPAYETSAIVLAGGSAGVVQWVVTYPLDVVKSKIQAFPPGTYKGMLDCARQSVKIDGPLVFFRGIEMALLRAFPLHASIFLTCETIHQALATLREDGNAEQRWKETGSIGK